MEFTIEDTVKLKTGSAPQIVRDIRPRTSGGYDLKCQYLSDREGELHRPWRNAEDYEHHETHFEKERIKMASKLYQTLEKETRYGTFLAVNSIGQIVLEMKGANGETEAFNKKDIEEVVPYTVKVVALGSKDEMHKISAKGVVDKNDMYVSNSGNWYLVVAVDTKSELTRGEVNGRKVMTEDITEL